MMRNYLLYIGLFLLFGCTSGKQNTAIEELDATPAHIIRLDDYLQDRSDKGITLGRMADRLEYVPLQTPDSLPVDIPMSVKVAGESVFVLDRTQTLFR